MDNKLPPVTKHIPASSEAWEGFPSEVETCSVPQPFCYFQFNKTIAKPYTFMMPVHHWQAVERQNKLEFLLAVRFGMEYDVSKLSDGVLSTTGFHTGMYVKFQHYLRKHYVKDAAILLSIFEQTAFTTRFTSSFAVQDLIGLKGTIEDLRIDKIMVGADLIAQNGGFATQINRKMYRHVFNQDYNPAMLKQLSQQGLYPDDVQFP